MAPSRQKTPTRLPSLRPFAAEPPTPVLVMIFVLAVAWVALTRDPGPAVPASAAPPSARRGFAAPDFTLETLDGSQLTLSDLRGRPVMLNLWASWCLPCRIEMPAIERVYQRHLDDGLAVVGLNVTALDSETAARAFAQEFRTELPDRAGP